MDDGSTEDEETTPADPTDGGEQTTNTENRGVKGTLTFPSAAFKVDYSALFGSAGEKKITLSATAPDGTEYSPDAITLKATEGQRKYEQSATELINKTVQWNGPDAIEYGWEDGKFHPILNFTITGEDGEVIKTGTLNQSNLIELGWYNGSWPEITKTETGFKIELPTELKTLPDVYGRTETYTVEWEFEFPAEWQGYIREEQWDEEKDEIIWRYNYAKNFTFTLDVRNGGGTITEAQVQELIRDNFRLYYDDPDDPSNPDSLSLENYKITYENGTVTIHDLPGYSGNQERIFSLQRKSIDDEPSDKITSKNLPAGMLPDEADGGDENDYYEITYKNTAANSGTVTDRVVEGGTLSLALTGVVKYEATKVWMDNDPTKRPALEFELLRYRMKKGYETAAPLTYESLAQEGVVVGEKTGFITITGDELAPAQNPETPGGEEEDTDEPGEPEGEGEAPSGGGNQDVGGGTNTDNKGEVPDTDPNDPAADKNRLTIQFDGLSLPKYDPDGYRYIYVVRETMTGDTADKYEQVFGKVTVDKDTGEETITDTIWPEGTLREEGNKYLYNEGTLTNRLTEYTTATVKKVWKASAYQAAMNDVAVEFRLERKLTTEGDDKWKPVMEKKDDGTESKITYVLHDFYAEKMEDSGSVGSLPRYDAEGQEYEYRWVEVAVYQGVELKADATQDEAKAALTEGKKVDSFENDDGKITFTLNQSLTDGDTQEVGYISTSVSEKNTTTITNTIDGTLDYAVKKTWVDENGKPTTPTREVTINIYRVPSGQTANLTTPYVSFTLGKDGKLVQPTGTPPDGVSIADGTEEKPWDCEDGNDHTDKFNKAHPAGEGKDKITTWDAIIQNLPKYDADGKLLEYVLLEQGGYPTYVTERFEDGCYATNVINGPGPGYRIMVQKVWQDDGDKMHRQPVTMQAYYKGTNAGDGKETAEPITDAKITLGEGDVWYDFIYLSEDKLKKCMEETGQGADSDKEYTDEQIEKWLKENVFVVETYVGNNKVDYNGTIDYDNLYNDPGSGFAEVGAHTVETQFHRYEVTHTKATEVPAGAHALFTVTNRRLGNIDLTVNKKWVTGNDQQNITKKVADMLKAINTATKTEVALAFMLDFDNKPDGDEWKITYTGNTENGDTVKVGGAATQIYSDKDKKTPASSVQPIITKDMADGEAVAAKGAAFFGLPKYATNGAVVKYTVEEVWVQKTTDGKWELLNGDGKLKNEGPYTDLYNFWDDFESSSTLTYKPNVDNGKNDLDEQTLSVTNRRKDDTTVVWYKEWRDNFASNAGNRPDIFLDIYAVSHVEGAGGTHVEQITRVSNDYRWTVLGDESGKTETENGNPTTAAEILANGMTPLQNASGAVVTELETTPAYQELAASAAQGVALLNGEGGENPAEPNPGEENGEIIAVASGDNDLWSVTITGLAEFDELGYPIEYYAVERTVVKASDFDYQAVQYSKQETEEVFGNRDGLLDGEEITDPNSIFWDNTLDLGKKDNNWGTGTTPPSGIGNYESTGDTGTYPRYALKSGNTFVNTLNDDYTITGQKVWGYV